MRCGPDTTLARVVNTFGEVKPHIAYVFANKRANRMNILLYDGYGICVASRRLHQGKFIWTPLRQGEAVTLELPQLSALVVGLTAPVQNRFHR